MQTEDVVKLDVRGCLCPEPLTKMTLTAMKMSSGQTLELVADANEDTKHLPIAALRRHLKLVSSLSQSHPNPEVMFVFRKL